MSRASLVVRAQAAAALGMRDACTIRRFGAKQTDLDTGQVTEPSSDVYTGKCRVQQGIAQADSHDAGENYLLQLRLVVQLPAAVTGVEVGDEVTITASQDPDLAGRVFLVRDLMHKTDLSSRRIGVTERTE